MRKFRKHVLSVGAMAAAALLVFTAFIATVGDTPAQAATTSSPRGESASVPTQETPLAGDMVWLYDQMAAAIAQYWVPGDYAIAVTDLQTGETVSVNGDRQQLAGCVINLFALYQVVRDLWFAQYPQDYVEALVAETIWSSNASTARELYKIIGNGDVVEGVRRVERLIREELDLDAVVLDHPPAFGESIGVSPDNWVTALSMNQALAALWHGQVVSEPSWRAFLLSQMTQVKPGLNYLTAAVPATVSHKNGFLPTYTGYVDNDAGIVRLQRDGVEYAYAITFLSSGVAEEYADITLAQQLGNLAFQVMSARYLY